MSQTAAKKERAPRKREVNAAVFAEPAPASPPAAKHPTDGSKTPPVQALPGININLQVHISADATADQIDQIFASMAKHIYQRV